MTVLLLLAAAIAPAPPAPPIVTVSEKAPVLARPRPALPVNLDIEIKAGNELLWAGSLRVSDRVQASFSRQMTEAAETICEVAPHMSAMRSSLSVNITRLRFGEDSDSYSLKLNWDRPGPKGNACEAQQSIRTIGLNQQFAFGQSNVVTIDGDNGLRVTIRRR